MLGRLSLSMCLWSELLMVCSATYVQNQLTESPKTAKSHFAPSKVILGIIKRKTVFISSSTLRQQWSYISSLWMISSREVNEVYSRLVRASDCLYQSRNSPGFDPAASFDTVGSKGRQMKQCCDKIQNSALGKFSPCFS